MDTTNQNVEGNNVNTNTNDTSSTGNDMLRDLMHGKGVSNEPKKDTVQVDNSNTTNQSQNPASPVPATPDTVEVVELKEGDTVEIENGDYLIDKDGNAVDSTGKVFKTSDEIKELLKTQDTSEPTTVVDNILKKTGFKFFDESGNPKKYVDTEDGVVELAKDMGKQFSMESQQMLIEEFPVIRDLIINRRNGGTDQEFYERQVTKWSNRKFDDKNESDMLSIVIDDMVAKGHDRDEAAEIAKIYRDKGSDELSKKAKAAFDSRVKAEKDSEQQALQEYANRQDEENKMLVSYWGEVNNIVNSGELESITIPQSDRNAFFKYLSEPVDSYGNSQAYLDEAQMDKKQFLQYKYLQYKKFNLASLVMRESKTDAVKTLREKLSSNNSTHIKLKNGQGSPKKVDASKANISLENFKH